ncbi:MAG: hypothetical protein AB7P76_12110 [Candidatus Melainabacteria bacterium]
MQKSLLKWLTFAVAARLARLETLLKELADSPEAVSGALQTELAENLVGIRSGLLDNPALAAHLFFQDTAETANGAVAPDNQGLLDNDALYQDILKASRQVETLEELLTSLTHARPVPEVHLLLQEWLPEDVLGGDALWTLLVGSASQQTVFLNRPAAPIGVVPLLHKNDPLGWLGLLPVLLNGDGDTVTAHLKSLRLLGPAYYFSVVIQGLLSANRTEVLAIEPLLFQGLQYFNLNHKSVILLHEAFERSRPAIRKAQSQVAAEEPVDMKPLSAFKAVEALIPDRLAMSEKALARAQALLNKLAEDTLISSSALYAGSDVAVAIEERLRPEAATEDRTAIYSVLGMLTEQPHTGREIVNAGWLNTMEHAADWLADALSGDTDMGGEAGSLSRLRQRLSYQDHLLRKSIETAEVHRVLLCAQPPVSV